jgi:hypothetical protein
MNEKKKYTITMPPGIHSFLKAGAARHEVTLGQLLTALVYYQGRAISGPGTDDMDKAVELVLAGERGKKPEGFATMVRRFRPAYVDGLEVKADE